MGVHDRSGEDDTPATTVVEVIAEAEQTSPTELPPLSETLSTDAFNTLARQLDQGQGQGYITFEYYGYTATVHSPTDIRLGHA